MGKRRRLAAALTSVFAALWLPLAADFGRNQARAEETGGFAISGTASFQAAPGVSHTSFTMTGEGLKQSAHLMEIDPKNPHIRLIAYSSRGEVSEQETVGRMIGELESLGMHAAAGFNGDFFSAVGVPSGLQITDGEIVTSPTTIKTMLLVMPDGSVRLQDSVRMTATLTADDGETLSINMINRTRVASHTNYAFVYTPRFGDSTRTPEGGVEAVIALSDPHHKLTAGQTLTGTIESVSETADTPISDGKLVLSASGTKADWVREHTAPGRKVKLDISFDKGVNEARQVISGNSTLGFVLLKDGQIPADLLDASDPNNTELHPRTILATKQGKLYVFAVDGRQPGFSDGLSLPAAARYLQSLGMEQAINIDGGGSTTYYARIPGDAVPSLLNRPSDGHERPVGNALVVLATTKPKHRDGLALTPSGPLRILSGSSVRFDAKGWDRYYNAVPVSPGDLIWTADPGIGTIDRTGLFTAGANPAAGRITAADDTPGNADRANKSRVSQSVDIAVTDRIARLTLLPDNFVVEAGGTIALRAKAYDEAGHEVLLSPDRLDWSVEGGIGTVSGQGVLRAVYGEASGKVAARYGTVSAEASVVAGKSPLIEPFESAGRIRSSEARTVPGSVTLSLASDPVRFGDHSAKLTYDFTGTSGTSGAYINFLDDGGKTGREIGGKPARFGVWLYGDANNHILRLGVTDGTGKNRIWNMTASGGINWTGWRYVYANVPEGTVFPLKVRNVVVEEASSSNKNAGVLYFDQFRAEYAVEGGSPAN
ncbi:phosphodiester glycosidase family protein [Paenibacillus sp. GYB003]|uniref:phosphodiester glycosidase family protein n=1 Tax=Paenibacillus sp. GYB003 TaxID=2994392 RepID=UPI002F9681ED